MSSASYKRNFKSNPSVNPETGRSIKVGGDTYNKLVDKYGKPSPKKSPRKTQKSPKKSPQRSPRMSMMKDPFEVLPEESILKVLNKLNEYQRMEWANASQKVRRIYQMNF
jgi:hypothetical protein